MPFYMADEEGFFAEQDLEVEFRRLGRAQDIMTALARGDVDVATGMLTMTELGLIASGARIRLVATLGEAQPDACTFLGIVARREHLESGALSDPAQIRRMRFDYNSILPFGYFLDELLRPYGLTTADLDGVDLPPPVALELLRRGDVTLDAEPYVTMHLETGEAAIWRGLEELLPGYAWSVVMFGPSLLDEHPDVGERLAVALLKGIRQYRLGRTPRNVALVEQATGLSPAQVADSCWPTMSEDGHADAAVFLGYQQWSVAEGLLDRVLESDELVDHRFMGYASAALAQ